MMSKCDENKKVAYKGHLIVSDALTTAEIDPQQYEIYFFQDNKAKKKKKLMVRSSIGIPKQCLSLLTVKSPKDIILLTHMYFFL